MEDVVVIIPHRAGRFAMLKRKEGYWTFPSGKIEAGEEPINAARRELQEETDLQASTLEYLGERVVADKQLSYFYAEQVDGTLSMQEPDKFINAEWLSPQEIIEIVGENIFAPVKDILLEKINHAA